MPAQTIRWLGVPWRPAHKLSAARVSLSAGRHQCIWPSTWDGLVLGGRGALGTPDGTDTPLTAGHAITWDGSAHGALEVVERLDLLIVVPPEHPGGSDRPETHPFSSGTGTRYMLPNAVAGGPSSEVTWHRDGPEGTGHSSRAAGVVVPLCTTKNSSPMSSCSSSTGQFRSGTPNSRPSLSVKEISPSSPKVCSVDVR